MKLLLDTQAFLYFIAGNPALSNRARSLIEDPVNDRFLSIAIVCEMAIKVSIGKLMLAQPLARLISAQTDLNGIELLPITLAHTATVATLPLHHRDPFDRMLVAQSMVEGLPLIGGDTAFDLYGIERIW
jgi:PIN domain nuclease of toxin-antitoxin system